MKRIYGAGVLFLLVALILAGCSTGTSAEDHMEKGAEFVKQEEYDKAIAEFEAALEQEPDNVAALTMLGVAYYSKFQFDEAISQYEEALEIAPQDPDIHSNLAAAYVQTGKLAKAQQEYQTAVDLQPDLAEAWFGLGVIHVQLGQNEEAIAAFTKFQEHDSGADSIATDLAKDYLEQLRGQ
jgi:Flp pilus assembly protein TadD